MCNFGYHLVGPQNITCLANGTWSKPLPSCEGNHYVLCARKAILTGKLTWALCCLGIKSLSGKALPWRNQLYSLYFYYYVYGMQLVKCIAANSPSVENQYQAKIVVRQYINASERWKFLAYHWIRSLKKPVGEQINFLPGTEKVLLKSWLGCLFLFQNNCPRSSYFNMQTHYFSLYTFLHISPFECSSYSCNKPEKVTIMACLSYSRGGRCVECGCQHHRKKMGSYWGICTSAPCGYVSASLECKGEIGFDPGPFPQ